MSGLPKIGVAFSFPIPGLVSQADTKLLITNPTIAAGDFRVWNPTGGGGSGAYQNLATTPTVLSATGPGVLISLSATEAGYLAGSGIVVDWQDVAGAQWCSGGCVIFPSARNLEDLAFPTTTGRSIDVTATGEVGIDLSNVGAPTTTLNLSGTTIKAVTDAVPTGLTVPTAAQNADAVWDEATAGHVATGSFGKWIADAAATIWTYATRTISQSAAAASAAVSGSTLTITRGSTWSATLTGLAADWTDYDHIDFMYKASLNDDDTAARVSIRINNPTGATEGLQLINGAATNVGDKANGNITVVSSTSVTLTLEAVETAKLAIADGGVYGLQRIKGTTTYEVKGTCSVEGDVVKKTA